MQLEDILKILNHRKHRDCVNWVASRYGDGCVEGSYYNDAGDFHYYTLNGVEALALALYYKLNYGKPKEDKREPIEVSRLYCKKHPKATFEIREVNLVGMPAIGHVFACTCYCQACNDTFIVSITEDLFWTIVQGGVKNWSAAPSAVAQANTQVNDYYKENVDVDPS